MMPRLGLSRSYWRRSGPIGLLYTGVTRGKRLVVLVGQKKAVAIAVRSVSGRRRWSKLREWLQSATPGRERNKHHKEVGGAGHS
jgi:hypothetical protein